VEVNESENLEINSYYEIKAGSDCGENKRENKHNFFVLLPHCQYLLKLSIVLILPKKSKITKSYTKKF
jgi:hypothetical protein